MKTITTIIGICLVSMVSAFANHASITLTSFKGEPMQAKLDGKLVNVTAANSISLQNIPAGKHILSLKVYRPNGVFYTDERIFLEPGYESEYYVKRYHGMHYTVELVDLEPLCRPTPGVNININIGSNGWDNHDDGFSTPQCNQTAQYTTTQVVTMDAYRIDRLVNTLDNISFDNTKLQVAKQALSGSNSYIMAADVRRIMDSFDFESSKLDFAKYAFQYTYDRENYFMVSNGFNFDSSVNDLTGYIASR